MIKFRIDSILPIFICLTLFFSYVSSIVYFFLGLSLIVILYILINSKRFPISKTEICPLVCLIISTFLIWNTKDIIKSVRFNFSIFVFLIIFLFIKKQNNQFKEKFLKFVCAFSFIHVTATIVERIRPNIIMVINKNILHDRAFYAVKYLLRCNKYSGISPQTGTDAYFICVFLCIMGVKLYKKRCIPYAIATILGIYALVLTRKRASILIIILICMFLFMYWLYNRFKGKNRFLFKFLLFLNFSFIIVYMVAAFDYLITLKDFDDFSSGRIGVYSFMLEGIKTAPIWGHGFGYVNETINIEGHNIYLQLLCEYGAFGFAFFIWFISWLIATAKKNINSKFTSLNLISLCFQIYFILYGIFGNPLYDLFEVGIYIMMYSLQCNDEEEIYE